MTRKEFEERIKRKATEDRSNLFESLNCLWQNKQDRFDMYDVIVELYNYRDIFARGDTNYERLTKMINQLEGTLASSVLG